MYLHVCIYIHNVHVQHVRQLKQAAAPKGRTKVQMSRGCTCRHIVLYVAVCTVLTQHQLVLFEHFINGGSVEPDSVERLGQRIAARYTAQDASLWEREER